MGKSLTVLGLQRSGTNFVEQCARSHWKQVLIQHTKGRGQIWKHDYNVEENVIMQAEKNFIYITKHPYTWTESVIKNPVDTWKRWPQLHKTKESKPSSILKSKQHEYDIERMGKLWTEHTSYWLEMMKKRKIIHVRYEDFIKSDDVSAELIKTYGKELGFEINNGTLSIPKKVSQSEKFDEQRRQKYITYKIDFLDWEKIEHLNNSLDHSLVRILGYPLFLTKDSFDKKVYSNWEEPVTRPSSIGTISPEEAAKRFSRKL